MPKTLPLPVPVWYSVLALHHASYACICLYFVLAHLNVLLLQWNLPVRPTYESNLVVSVDASLVNVVNTETGFPSHTELSVYGGHRPNTGIFRHHSKRVDPAWCLRNGHGQSS